MTIDQLNSEEKSFEKFLTPDQLSGELYKLDEELRRIMDNRCKDFVTDSDEVERIKTDVENRLGYIRDQIITVRNVCYGDVKGDMESAEKAIERLNEEVPNATEHILRLIVQLRHPETFKEFAL